MDKAIERDGAPVIGVRDLVRHFKRKIALDGVSLDVPPGVVFGLVGENGAGKTTLIRHLLGLMQPTAGTVRVFGRDPVADPVGVLSRLGYLSEDRDLPHWMRVDELMGYSRAFYPAWDDAYAERLRKLFKLDPASRIRTLSRGEKAKAGLLTALAYRPELLLLDEPSSGLDPAVRQDILEAILRDVVSEGRTVLFSSHLLDEIERVADIVAMIHHGRVVLCGSLEEIKRAHTRLSVQFVESRRELPEMAGVIEANGLGRDWTLVCLGDGEAVRPQIAALGGEVTGMRAPSLEEIFIARVHGRRVSGETAGSSRAGEGVSWE
ncbi:MAG: ABC transporter ATP-binding protein [Candidatus Hydrogenedens sp.]|nr:ABC transporter ATP-binding protein [Candidatus Hydrogenedentota bacterium]NLF58812.1 ABC transporter ATP-binding protein [Candidatus Hydrogenedens sp.]